LFGGDISRNLIAFDPANRRVLWHGAIGQVRNAPQTIIDGRQYVLVAAGDSLSAFALYQ
jgi:alcohol dehydrogenase (cytochrome c)